MLTSPVGAASGCVGVPSETAFEAQPDVAPSGAQKIVMPSTNPMAGAMGYTTTPASRANTISETVLILALMGILLVSGHGQDGRATPPPRDTLPHIAYRQFQVRG